MSKKRKTKRRKRRVTPILWLLSILLTVGAAAAALTMFFEVGKITVVGNIRHTAEEIVEATGVQTGDNLILLSRHAIAQTICEGKPYVKTVQLRRKLPDELVVTITEETAVASANDGGSWWLLSQNGKLLEQTDESVAEQYLRLIGTAVIEPKPGQSITLSEDANITNEKLSSFLSILQERNLLERVQRLDVSQSVWRMILDERFEVELFGNADYDYKLDCLMATIERLEPNEVGTIRMTMTDEREVRFIPKR